MEDIDAMPWDPSQSGRRKQNFGPKTTFNRRKLKIGSFRGFPEFGRRVQERLTREPVLAGYQTIEQCSLEYRASEGACISPHIDDCWVWGERVVTLSLLSDSVLTMVKYTGGQDRYNMTYEPACRYNQTNGHKTNGQVDQNNLDTTTEAGGDAPRASNLPSGSPEEPPSSAGATSSGDPTAPSTCSAETSEPLLWHELSRAPTVRLPMPPRSLLVMQAEARYEWLHGILRSDIAGRRVCLALREFTPAFMPGGEEARIGAEVTAQAQCFFAPQTANGEVGA